jgi:hypothetical protein
LNCRRNAAPHRNERNFLGYFTDNELFWGTGWNPGESVLDAMLYQAASAPGKREAVRFLKERYNGDLQSFCAAWGRKLGSWEEAFSAKEFDATGDRVLEDKRAFLFHFARRYFKIVDKQIKKSDPNHLNLGCRVHGWCEPEVVRAMGEFVDVISYNKYDNNAPVYQIEDYFAAIAKRPVLVSEWGFRAMDSGLPNTGGVGRIMPTQDERGRKYAEFLEGLARMPSCIGSVFYSYCDDPAGGGGGIMGNENSNYGIVDFHDKPYAPFVRHVKRANAKVYQWRLEGPKPDKTMTIATPRDFQREPVDRFFIQRNGTVLNQRYLRAFLRGAETGMHHQSQTFEMDFEGPVKFLAWVYEVEGHPLLEMVLDAKKRTVFDLPSGEKLGRVSYRMPEGWHTVYDEVYGIAVGPGHHTIEVVNRGSGWLWLNAYRVVPR